MKMAIVYDWLDKWGGVERVLLVLHEMFPDADWYTSYVDFEKAKWLDKFRIKNSELRFKIRTSFIQKLPGFIKKSRVLSIPFYPYAFESFDFSKYDTVISVTSSFAKGIITKPKTKHICYMLTPTRYLWGMTDEYLNTRSSKLITRNLVKIVTNPLLVYLRKWDYIAAQRPDKIISISKAVADRCRKYYARSSEVIYPPFDIEHWKKIKTKMSKPKGFLDSARSDRKYNLNDNVEQYYLLVSRLEPYKKIDMVISIFNKRSDHLVIVGKGSQSKKLKQSAHNNINFIDNLSDEELAWVYSNAQALIMPQEEDFGYVSLEAQFFGCPVVSYNKGGVKESLFRTAQNILFEEQSEPSLERALERLLSNTKKGKLKVDMSFFEQFSKMDFIDKLKHYII